MKIAPMKANSDCVRNGLIVGWRQQLLSGVQFKGERMGLYLMLSNLIDKGRQRVKSHPERIKEVNAEVESQG